MGMKEQNLVKVVFELDAKLVVDAVNKTQGAVDWRLRNLIKDIKQYFISFNSWKLSYIPKERNTVADVLSKLARVDGVTHTWGLVSPEEIRHQLAEDAKNVTI